MGRIMLIGLLLLGGCATRERVVYQELYIPVKCKIDAPIRPIPQTDTVLMAMDVIDYAKALEIALRACL
ncbi:MAG: hypothetical protein LBV09_07075 [Deferribacteraceae bacterium]|jgi:hypothetical protein|nr:hypothetical protein [Deferribacteraceae bacterium]